MRTLPITSPIYTERTPLRNYFRPESPLSLVVANRAAVRLLRNRLPSWTKADHAKQYLAMRRLFLRVRKEWSKEADRASMLTFGRPWSFTDYKISGIGRDEFPADSKKRLRFLAHRASDYSTAADLHATLAGSRVMRQTVKGAK